MLAAAKTSAPRFYESPSICVTDWDGNHHEQILTASFSGIHRYKLQNDGRWTRTEIAKGAPEPWPKCGASEVAVGHLGARRFLCTIEPWHGNHVCVYLQPQGSWSRQVLDETFQDGHALTTAVLNRDRQDEIIAGYRGRGGGLVYYSAEDDSGLHWKRYNDREPGLVRKQGLGPMSQTQGPRLCRRPAAE